MSEEKNKEKKEIIIHPLLFAAFPIIFLLSFNIDQMINDWREVPVLILLVEIVAIILWSIVSFLVKERLKAAISVTCFFFFFFSYREMGKILTDNVGTTWYFLLWIVILFFAMRQIIITKQNLQNFSNFLDITGLLLVLITGGESVYQIYRYEQEKSIPRQMQTQAISPKIIANPPKKRNHFPNIYYIILDGYARSDVMKTKHKYDNKPFIDYLKKRGFFVAEKSHANYCLTRLSLAASMNLNYVDKIAADRKDSVDYNPLIQIIRDNYLARQLKQWGYKTVSFPTGVTVEIRDVDIFLGKRQLTEFQNTVIHSCALTWIADKTKLSPYESHRQRILNVYKRLPEIIDVKEPVFVFAHIIAPHPPFVFTEKGESIDPDREFNYDDGTAYHEGDQKLRSEYVKKYSEEARFITKKTIELIEKILKNSSQPPIIIVQSDHGSGLDYDMVLEKTDLQERLSILNAYYIPDMDYSRIPKHVTPVNTFRVIFNYLFDTQFTILPDKSYYSSGRYPYRLKDVTQKLK